MTGGRQRAKYRVADLCRAAAQGDLKRATRIVKSQPDLVNLCLAETDERRPLHFAVMHQHADVVQLLMEAGASHDLGVYPHRTATSALCIAEDRGYDQISRIIRREDERRQLEACSNIVISPENDTLFHAIENGRTAQCIRLLNENPDLLDACQRNGGSVIYTAARNGRPRLVSELLRRGADIEHLTPDGKSPLDGAVLNSRNHHGRVSRRHRECIQLLSAAGARPSLQTMIALGDVDGVTRFHKDSPTAFAPHEDGPRLIEVAVRHRQVEMVRLLLQLGLHPDERHRLREYEREVFNWGLPLWWAAGDSLYEIADLLLEAGADSNAEVYASGNPLSRAYNNRDDRMKRKLFRYGARLEPYIVGIEGEVSAAAALLTQDSKLAAEMLDSAVCGGDPDTVAICLVHLGGPPDTHSLGEALRLWQLGPYRKHRQFSIKNYHTILRMLLDAGADPNQPQRFGYRILHDVVTAGVIWDESLMPENDRCRFAATLIDYGAELNVIDELLQSTPLGWAARWGKHELTRLFLDRGADPNLAGANWARPLDWAEKKGHARIARLLKRRGANSASR